MWVICGGMYRSCSTWQYGVASYLTGCCDQSVPVGYLGPEDFAPVLSRGRASRVWNALLTMFRPDRIDLLTKWIRARYSGQRLYRVMKCHEGNEEITRLLGTGKALGLYCYRDLRDVVYSLMHRLGASFESVVVDDAMLHRCMQYDYYWRNMPNVLVQRYEEVVQDHPKAVREIAAHLRVQLDQRRAIHIADLFALEASRSRLGEIHVRQGAVGGWRTELTPDQMTLVEHIVAPWLKANKYPGYT